MDYPFYNLWKWRNLKDNSPHEQTRNQWLYKYGAFAFRAGLWFPCRVVKLSTIGEPASLVAVPIAQTNLDIYPKGEILAQECEVIYSVFNDGTSIQAYISQAVGRIRLTNRMLNAGIKRALNTELLYAPKRLLNEVKRAANREDKTETFVLTSNNKEEIGTIELPRTIDIVEKLWDTHDWAVQELSQLLGISYNPSHGKKERLIQNELLGDRDMTIMNREMITSRLRTAAEKFGESVVHISTEIDVIDRQLRYGAVEAGEEGGFDNGDDSVPGTGSGEPNAD